MKSIFNGKTKNQYQKKSYAQSGEDLIIDFIFHELKNPLPTYIDIGAHHPFYLNNTAIFYERGGQGINIEPDPTLFMEFTWERKRDTNLNIGISGKEDILDFYQISTPTLNTFSYEEAVAYNKQGDFKIEKVHKIPVDTVNNILKKYNNNIFPDFLSLDAEGIDEIVLQSINYQENFPKVICVETISFSTTGRCRKNNDIISFLIEKGYLLYADTYINSIFVKKDIWER